MTVLPLLLFACVLYVECANPFITHRYAADPAGHVWDSEDRLYVYASHDQPNAENHNSMDQYYVYSTDNLVDWTDHGMVLHVDNVSWADSHMWAPDAVYWKGRYYLVYCAKQARKRHGPIFRTGMAVSDKPTGPFKDVGFVQGIEWGQDPALFVDDDDTPWLYWGLGGAAYVARLTEDLLHVEYDSIKTLTDQLPGFYEGPWVFLKEGLYYMMYPVLVGMEIGERLEYATASTPEGPWTRRGVLMNVTHCWTNHGSIVEFRNQWYLLYHTDDLSGGIDARRSLAMELLHFNPDGTIEPVTPTKHGPPPSTPFTPTQHAKYVATRQQRRQARGAAMRAAREAMEAAIEAAQMAAAREAARQEARRAQLRFVRHREPALMDTLPSIVLKPHVHVVEDPFPDEALGGDRSTANGDGYDRGNGDGYDRGDRVVVKKGGASCRLCLWLLEGMSYVFSPWY